MHSLLSRVPAHRHAAISKASLGIAVFLAFFALLFFMGFSETERESGALWWKKTEVISLDERRPYLIVAIVLIAVALGCAIVAARLYLLRGRLNRYVPMLDGTESVSLQELADTTGTSSARVLRDVQAMIDSGVVQDYYVDMKARRVVSRKYVPKNSYKTVVECENCGGTTEVVVGIGRPCRYCRTPLVGV